MITYIIGWHGSQHESDYKICIVGTQICILIVIPESITQVCGIVFFIYGRSDTKIHWWFITNMTYVDRLTGGACFLKPLVPWAS